MKARTLTPIALTLALAASVPAAADPSPQAIEKARANAVARLSSGDLPKTAPAATATCNPLLMLCGQLVQTSLESTSCATTANGSPLGVWAFPAYSPQAVGIAVSSADFAPAFLVIDAAGDLLATGQAPQGSIASAGAYLSGTGIYGIGVVAPPGTASTATYQIALVCGDYPCQKDAATLCLLDGRFRLQSAWTNQFNDTLGFSSAIPRTDETAFFTFGDPSDIELLTKMLDFGTTIKLYYGELTDLQFSLAVTDMLAPTQPAKTYTNTAGDCGTIDQSAFPSSDSLLRNMSSSVGGGCKPGKNTLCLLDKRFSISMTWMNQYNSTNGVGSALSLSDETGAFSFTDPSDLEVLFKMIDFGDRVAVYYGTLSNLAYTATVVDTRTGQVKTYVNPPGTYCGGLDNSAFPP
jgi:hypothetical protein